MNRLLYQHINNHIMAYKSKTGAMPNAILLPYTLYEDLINDFKKMGLEYKTDCAGDGTIYGLEIIVTEEKVIRPIRRVRMGK